jgi:hypothetical protein
VLLSACTLMAPPSGLSASPASAVTPVAPPAPTAFASMAPARADASASPSVVPAPRLTNVSIQPALAAAGALVTLTYTVEYASTPIDVRLGASLYPPGSLSGAIDDFDNDEPVTLTSSQNTYKRAFLLQPATKPGTYDVVVSLLTLDRKQVHSYLRSGSALEVRPSSSPPTRQPTPNSTPAEPQPRPLGTAEPRPASTPTVPILRASPTPIGDLIAWAGATGPGGCDLSAGMSSSLGEIDADGSAILTGVVRNPCAQELSAQVDARLVSADSVTVAQSQTVGPLAPGTQTTFTAPVPGLASGKRYRIEPFIVYWFVGSRSDESVCWEVGASTCLKADPLLSGAVARLNSTREGPALLRTAADANVPILRGDAGRRNYAVTEWQIRAGKSVPQRVIVDLRMDAYSSWERAATLAHELRHVTDLVGGLDGTSAEACYQTEHNAFMTQAGVWTDFWGTTLPSATQPQRLMASIIQTIHSDPYEFVDRMQSAYQSLCDSRRPG